MNIRKTFTLFLTMILVVLTVCLQTLSAQTDRHNVQNSPSGRLTHVTSAQALEVGYAFMRTNTHSRGNVNVSKQSMRLVYTGVAKDSVTRAVTDCYYVFSLQPTGFVMVAADERVRPILGYSYSDNFVAEDIPDNVRSWLENYSKQIKTAIDNDSQSCSETRTMWELLRSGRATATRNITSIAPLLQTTWDQGCYYNQFCPEDSLGSCGHVWAGCVAVAMAQVVRYWEWPNHGLNSHSYTCDYGTLSVNFGATTYNYNNMPNGLSSSTSTSQKEEVAKLIYHCGVAVEMDYAPGGSSAYSSDVPDALYDYFAYADNGTYVSRYNYSDSDWVNLIKHELDSLRPVYYSGHGTGGHAFVCDGYDNNGLFHFNWGWNGWYDGYFELSALTPSTSNFSSDQAAIIGIRSSGTFMRCSDSELSFFARVGEESAPQSISVCGHGLSGNISVSAGSGFKVSSDGANYYDILTLPAAGGTMYVKYIPTQSGDVADSLILTSGSYSLTVALNGTDKVIVGSGTATNAYLPSYSYYSYSLTQQIYTPAEIGTPGYIYSIDFYNDGPDQTRNLDMYLVHTDKQTFANGTDWIPVTENDKVFSGVVTLTSGAWTTFQINNFAYDGESNLALVVDDNTGNWSDNYMVCRVFYAQNQALRVYDDYTNYVPANPSGYSGTVLSQKNQLRIGITPAVIVSCGKPSNLVFANLTTTSVSVSWSNGSGTFGYEYKKSSDTVWTVACQDNCGFNCNLTGLLPNTTYQFRVRSVCAGNTISAWLAGSFTTLADCSTIYTLPFFEGFDSGSLPECWQAIDSDGDGYTWDAAYWNDNLGYAGYGHTGAGCVASASYINNVGALTPNNWLISPPIAIPSQGASLSFWARVHGYPEPVEVLVSTTGNAIANFTGAALLTQTITSDTYTEYTVNLAAYAGQNIYIAFVHRNVTDQYWLMLDDVSVYYSPTNPGIVANPTTLDFDTVILGQSSAVKTSDVSAYNLINSITATTTAPFEISADGTTFATTATVAQTGGTLYMRYTPTAIGAATGTVTLSSTGASDVFITMTGYGFDTICSIPSDLFVTETGLYRAMLSWTENGTATGWQICLDEDESNLITVASLSYMFTNLSSGMHFFKVRANCGSDGYSGWSNSVSVYISPCESPYNLKTTASVAGTASISWQGNSDGYNLRYRPSGNSGWTLVTGLTSPTYTISGLVAGDYEVEVAAVCDSLNWIPTTFSIMEVLSSANWYGYTGFDYYNDNAAANESHKFVSFSMQNPVSLTSASGTLHASSNDWYALSAAYANGYVWCITQDGDLSRATLDNNNKTISEFETIIPGFENTYSNSMSYNPVDGRIYYNMFDERKLKSFDPLHPEDVTEIGTYNINVLTFAINSAGEAFCVEISTGDFYRLSLHDASSIYIGNTGKNVNYAQSMAFDLQTNELFWAQYYSSDNCGLYKVNPSTAATCLVGQIGGGNGTEFTGLFMGDNAEIACPAPTNLVATLTQSNAPRATLSWTENGNATSWQVCINGDETNLINVNTPSYTLVNLSFGTDYTVKVRSVCSSTDQSYWSYISFSTDFCMLEDQCEISCVLQDSYGDGWNGGAIKVVDDLTNKVLSTWTISNGSYASDTLLVCDGRNIRFEWVSGSYDYECSYTVLNADGDTIFSGSGTMSDNVVYAVDCHLVHYDHIYVTENGTGDGSSWTTATGDLQWALNTALNIRNTYGVTPDVWVAAGTYYGDTTSSNAFTMVEGVNVYGGFAGNEPADYDLSLRDFEANATILDGMNARRVLWSGHFDNASLWEGFTIQHGRSYVGGGVCLFTNAKISHCKIVKNECINGGGGGGVYSDHGFVTNCLIANNTDSWGGGMVSLYSSVVNTTIVRNSSNSSGVYGDENSVFTNCIIWGNKLSDGTPGNLYGTSTCSYSAIEGGCQGDSIIALNAGNSPLFVNPSLTAGADDVTANVDWHLHPSSPCINAGDNSAVTDAFDLDGNLRIYHGRVDMGCYEWQGSQVIPVGDAQPCADVPTVADFDEITYNTVKVGNQCWMKENLRSTHYSDGTVIPLGNFSTSESTPYCYWPGNNSNNVPAYGYLYNWSAVMRGMNSNNANPSAVQGVCPVGWHVPSAAEWSQLFDYVKGESVYRCGTDSNNIAKALASIWGWNSTQTECAVGNDAGQNNLTGFGAMPAGNFYGLYDNFNSVAFFWTSSDTTMQPNYNTYSSVPFPIFCAVNSLSPNVESRTEYKSQGFSVRCLKNDTLVADYSGIIFVTPSGAGDHSGSSWANATSSIDTAQILAQEHNAVVWVAAGTYYGDTTSSNAFTMVEGVNVYGGFAGNEPANYDLSLRNFEANATILDGMNARRVLYQPFEFNGRTEWDGFTIQHGQTSGNGGGAYLRRNAVLSQCRIQGNVSSSDISGGGGGVYCNNASVDKCNVYGNTSLYNGGGVYATNSTVSDCRIERNAVSNHYPNPQYYGGGGIRASSSTITGCRIKGNQSAVAGGGVFSSGAVLSGCEILENTAVNRGGGINFTGSNSRVTDCLVGNNTATNVGGGISGGGMVVNTTIVRNTSTGDGAGVNGTSSATQITLTNCIVWGNERNGAPDNVGGNLTCSYSAIEGGHEGDSIIVLNNINPPLFVNPSLTAGATDTTANVDWHLQNGSVCVNRGSNSAVTDSLDLDGTARVKRDTVDLGCYESDFYSVPVLYCTTVYGEFAATACDSYSWNDQVYSHSGDYQQTFPLANGCDSIATLHLTVHHAATTREYLTVCASDLPYLYGDTLLDISTPQSLIISSQRQTQYGCDSTVILFLTVTPSTVGDFAAMTPTNNYPITAYPIRFTWDAVENASNYDLYVWPVGESQPQQPTASHIHGTSYTLSSLANRGAYQWFMTAYNACDTSVSSTRQFTLNVTPTLTVNTNNPVDMGEVQLNGARSIWFQVNGIALDSVISYQLTGTDSAAFALLPTATWDSLRGGRMQLTFHPTVAQAEYTAQMTFYSDTLVRTFTIKGHLADYLTFTTYVDTNIYAMDSQIPIHGRVTNPLNEPVAGLEVEVYVSVMDYVRTFPAISDANGQFTVMFTPQHSEAGYYTVGSRRAGGNSTTVHDDFNIPGMMLASSDWILWEPTIDQPDTGVIAVRNRSQIPLTNIQVTPVSLPNGCTVQFVPLNLAGMATGNLQFIVSGSEVSTGVNYEEVRLNAVSSEGAAMSFSAWYYCMPQRAALDVTPTSLITTMTRGKSKVVDFKIYNNGTGPTGDIYVSLPNVPWMSVVGSDTLPSLAVHDSAYVSIRLSADSTTALVRYTGNFVINCERGEDVSIPYSITAISDSTGTLLVDVTDEYTWNTNGGHGPHLAGANVTVKGYYSLETVATGVTDANGHFVVNDLPEGYYKLIVRADRHAEYQGALLITAGDTNRQDIFIQFQAITYSWEVVPTEIQDEYTYELNVKFETHVPAPVVTMDVDRQLPLLEDCEAYSFNLIVTNHGLIAAQDFSVIVPDYPYYVFTPLIGHFDSLPAQSTQIIPVVMRRRDCVNEITGEILPQPTGMNPNDPDSSVYPDPCIKTVFKGQYMYHCDVDRWVLVYSKFVSFSYEVDPINCMDTTNDFNIPSVVWRPRKVIGIGSYGMPAFGPVAPFTRRTCDSTVYYEHPCGTIAHSLLDCGLSFLPPVVGSLVNVPANAVLDNILENNPHLVRNAINGVESGAVSVVFQNVPVLSTVYSCTKGVLRSWNTIPDCWYYLRGEYPYVDSAMLLLKKGLNYIDYGLNMFERFVCGSLLSRDEDSFLGQIGCNLVRWKTAPAHILNDFVSDFVDSQLDMELPDYQIGQITLQKQDRLVEVYGSTLGDVTPDDIRMLCARWNNSVDYWNQGYYYYSDLPATYDHNCIMFDNIDFDAAIDAETYAVRIGFSHPYEMYNSAVAMLNDFAQDYMNRHTSSSVCASVTVQFSQKMTMTREAFQGTLAINNGHESQPMQDIDVNFVIRDEDGVDCTNLFQINFQSYNNMTGSNGSLVLNALNEGSIVVQFIPTKQAAPTMPKQYSFGGSFSFIDPFTGEFMTYNLYPVDIMVNPCPDLYVNYFMQRDILGDDPLTEDRIEPIVPAELGVIIHNRGAGTAKNVLLETAEPKIIDNEKGLAVDFAMYGAAFNGNERQLGLMEIPFGNIEPGRTGVGEWWFTSTLLGHFVSYEAHVIHNNSFDNPDLSLVSSLDIHPLIHTVYAYGNLDDGINDFLVDDVDDILNYPDSLYFSNGSRTAVATADSISFDHYVTPIDTIVILTLDPSRIGWNYEQTWDPGRGQYKLVSCTRNSDQQVIPLSNIWQSHVTIPVGADPIYENRLHIVDTLSNDLPTTYTLVFSLYDLVLEVDSIRGVPDTIMQTPLTSVIVKFNKSIVDSTFTYSDMSLRCNNGPNLLDENLQIEKLDSVTYRLHLAPYTTQSGYYVLNIQTLDITDTVGFNGYYGKQVTWIQNIQTCLPVSISVAETICQGETYIFHGRPLVTAGSYTDTLQTVHGCDSIVTLHLTVNHGDYVEVTVDTCGAGFYWPLADTIVSQSGTYYHYGSNANACTDTTVLMLSLHQPATTELTAQICAGEVYDQNGFNVSTAGDHYLILQTTYGCDSVVILHLTVGGEVVTHLAASICEGESYNENGFEIIAPAAGVHDYSNTIARPGSCDSIVTLHLTVNHSTTGTVTAVACDSYDWYGTTYTQSGDYTHTLTNANGCDSIVTLHLTVNHTTYGNITVVACDSYDWYGTTYTQSGDYTHTLANAHGCDSIVTLHLTVNHSTMGTVTAVACDSYDWYGSTYTQSGDYTHTLINANGCDSIVTLHLTVNHTTYGNITVVACDSYDWYGTTYTQSGDYTHTLTNAAGCDSVVTLHLTVNHFTTGAVTAVACDSYDWYGTTYTQSGDYTHTLTNAAGCDSIVTLHLTVNHSTTGAVTAVACDSYDWYGTTYTQSGDYTHTLTNAHGCDSIVTLHLTVNHSTTSDITAVACDSYDWYGTTYTQSGDYTHTLTNAAGCDSIITLHLTVNHGNYAEVTVDTCGTEFFWEVSGQSYDHSDTYYFFSNNSNGCQDTAVLHLSLHQSTVTEFSAQICEGGTYNQNGFNVSEAGDYVQHLHTIFGCDSTVTLHLTVDNAADTNIAASICEGENYIGNGFEIIAPAVGANEYRDTIQRPGMCDSIVTLYLTVNHTTYGDVTAVACDSYDWYGNSYTQSGVYTHTLTNAVGCDSIVTLHLTVNHTTYGAITAVACDSYDWYGTTYTQSGDYTHTLTNAHGCDSILTLHLTVNHSTTGTITAVVCDSYYWYGTTYTQNGDYTHTLTNAAGCDSIITLHLTVNHGDYVEVSVDTCGNGFYWPLADTMVSQSGTYYHYSTNANACTDTTVLMLSLHQPAVTELTAQICAGELYDQNGFNVSTAGDHYLNFQTVHGCDSVVILHLTVGGEVVTHLAASICEGESYNENGFEIIAPAVGVYDYSNTVVRPGSCDSIVTLHLTVNHSTTDAITAVACDSYDWYGATYTQSGDYTHTLTNVAGCDSIVTLHLTVNHSTTGSITAVACDSYDWYGTTYTQSGDYTHTLTNAAGCDSIVTLHLTVNHTTYGNVTAVACNSYDWYGTTYTQSGDYTHTLTNAAGCDSIVTLHLTVNHTTYGNVTAVACDSYDWYGTTYTQSGDYTQTLTNAHGCDSIVTLHLTVNHSTYGNVTAVACDSYDWYGTTYTQSGNYTHTLANAAGCDSIVTLHLTVNHTTYGNVTAVACDSYDWYGTTYTQSGDYTHTLTNAHGCDSIVMLHLTVNYTTYGNITAVACNSYDWYGTTYTQSGDYTHTLTNVNGCDSIVTLHLTVNHTTYGNITAVACNSYDWYGTTYTQSGDYTHTLTNAHGCDSVLTLHLTVNYTTYGSITAVACDSYDWYGTTYTQSGDYTHTLTNANGCDSIVTLHLTVNHTTYGAITAVACDSYDWYGTTYTQSGDYTHTLTNAAGCDSILTLHLTVNHTTYGAITAVACDSYDWYGTTYTQSGDYTHMLTNANGCDSILTLHLTVNPTTYGNITAVACDSYDWYGTAYTQSGDYTHTLTNAAGCDSILTLHLTVNHTTYGAITAVACDSYDWYGTTYTQSGDYTHTLTNAAGCDSIVTLHLTVNYTTYGSITAAACDSYDWYDSIYTQSGDYTHTLTNAAGCDSIVTLHLTVTSTPEMFSIMGDSIICMNQFAPYYYNITDNNYHYQWYKSDLLWAEDVDMVMLHEMTNGPVSLVMRVEDLSSHCTASTTKIVQVQNGYAPDTTVIRRKGNTNILVCQPVTSSYGVVHYQWGYTDRISLNETLMNGDYNYCRFDMGIDTQRYDYWVETYMDVSNSLSCANRSYYGHSLNTSVEDYDDNVVDAYMTHDRMILSVSAVGPNPIVAGLYDVNGRLLFSKDYGITDKVSDNVNVSIANGIYFLRVTIGNQLYSVKLLKIN